jgi:hypothetical protein
MTGGGDVFVEDFKPMGRGAGELDLRTWLSGALFRLLADTSAALDNAFAATGN